MGTGHSQAWQRCLAILEISLRNYALAPQVLIGWSNVLMRIQEIPGPWLYITECLPGQKYRSLWLASFLFQCGGDLQCGLAWDVHDNPIVYDVLYIIVPSVTRQRAY